MKKTGKEILGASVHTETPDSQNEDTKKVAAGVLGASIHTDKTEHSCPRSFCGKQKKG